MDVKRRIGIDVGGTNTDAVYLEDTRVVHAVKTPTTRDVTSGVTEALRRLLRAGAPIAVDAVMIGTTHFTNAVVQRRDMTRVAAVRIGLHGESEASERIVQGWARRFLRVAGANQNSFPIKSRGGTRTRLPPRYPMGMIARRSPRRE